MSSCWPKLNCLSDFLSTCLPAYSPTHPSVLLYVCLPVHLIEPSLCIYSKSKYAKCHTTKTLQSCFEKTLNENNQKAIFQSRQTNITLVTASVRTLTANSETTEDLPSAQPSACVQVFKTHFKHNELWMQWETERVRRRDRVKQRHK